MRQTAMVAPPGARSVFTDGACSGNPGPGGWAWAVDRTTYGSGSERVSTNQRMEVRAALEAITALDGPLLVVSDSTYVVNCFRDRWWQGWQTRGWLNSAKKPVANRDLWEPLVTTFLDRGDVAFAWVKGHSGHAMNDFVDQLAVAARPLPDRQPQAAPWGDLAAGSRPAAVAGRGCTWLALARHRCGVNGSAKLRASATRGPISTRSRPRPVRT